MTDHELRALFTERQRCWAEMAHCRALRTLPPTTRLRAEFLHVKRADLTKRAIAELKRRGGKFEHWCLTDDSLSIADLSFAPSASAQYKRPTRWAG